MNTLEVFETQCSSPFAKASFIHETFADAQSTVSREDLVDLPSISQIKLAKQEKSEEEKRLKKLLRNREAARRLIILSRNRLKKKDWIQKLQAAHEEWTLMNGKLKAQLEILSNEYANLQNELMSKTVFG